MDGQRGLSRLRRPAAPRFARGARRGPGRAALAGVRPPVPRPMQIVLVAARTATLYPLKQLGTGILLIL